MARVNVYLPDDLAAAAKAADMNLSAMTQEAIRRSLAARSTDAWLARLAARPHRTSVSHERALAALDAARDEAPTRHIDAEVLSAVGRLHRAGAIDDEAVESALQELLMAPIERHPVADLLIGAWSRCHRVRLADALYLELAHSRGMRLVTTDRRLRNEPNVDVVQV